jgi:hypothetical protein
MYVLAVSGMARLRDLAIEREREGREEVRLREICFCISAVEGLV